MVAAKQRVKLEVNRHIRCLKSKDDEVRAYASSVLWKIGLEAKATFPVLA